MVRTVSTFILFCFVFLSAHNAFSQSRPDIGTFDINKVAQSVQGGANALASDTGPSAATAPAVDRITGKTSENWTLVSLRIGLYLILTITAIFLVIWGIKRIGLAGRSKIGGGSMDVLEALPLGQNRAIVLVRVVDKVYLIGQTQNQISVLETIEGQKALELISTTKGVVSMAQFKDVFNNFMGKFKK
jgi:flagellar biosynthetic protein FliO